MTQLELKNLRFIQRIMLLATLLLVMAEIGYILMEIFSYMVAVIGAIAIFLLRLIALKFGKSKGIKKILLTVLPLIVIFGPLIYTFIQLITVGGGQLWFDFILLLGFVMPILILLYCNQLMQKILTTVED